jgi:AAA15 family ATPase/GTPase
MLKSWSVEHFKPIVNSGNLELAPITILAGLNSCGKSSLLQSILVVSQTLSNPPTAERALLPTARLVQLGTFEDILNSNSHSRTLDIGFELEVEKEEATFNTSVRTSSGKIDVTSIKAEAKFISISDKAASSSAIEASKVTMETITLDVTSYYKAVQSISNGAEPAGLSFIFNAKKIDAKELNEKFLRNVKTDVFQLSSYSVEQYNYLGSFIRRNQKSGDYIVTVSQRVFHNVQAWQMKVAS